MPQAIYGYRLVSRKHDPKGVRGDWAFVSDVSDTLQVYLNDVDGTKYHYGDYEAYHASGWAAEKGLEVEHCKFDFDPQRMTFTKSNEPGYI
jgi:hypothetical protein